MSTASLSILVSSLGALFLAPHLVTPVAPAIPTAFVDDGDGDDDHGHHGDCTVCERSAELMLRSAMAELEEERLAGLAMCANLEDRDERRECLTELREAYREGRELAFAQYEAREDLCDLLGEDRYDPEIDRADFTTVIDNPLFPLPVGASWTYESATEDGLETIVVTVLPETREILGVECVTVRDVVSLDGEPVEDTLDWYAQDADGNVWYFGEIVFNFEDGFVADISGSWVGGVNGAKPGIVMLAAPTPGTTYRQEWFLGEAEDAATVLATDATVSLGLGTFVDCLQTADFQSLDPDALENKFYAPGVGFVHETKPGTTETVELVSYRGL